MSSAADEPEDEAAIRARALNLLARREHARSELITKLCGRGYDLKTVQRVAVGLSEENLLSEARYAEAAVYARARRGQGPERIRAELAAREIDDTLIDAALADAGQDWHLLAAQVYRKHFGDAPPADFPEKAKRMRFLQRRGFGPQHIQSALDDLTE